MEFDLYEAVSALQKEIRRGHEREALFWAFQLVGIGEEQHLWTRLEVISHEDIGIAAPMASLCISTWARTFRFFRSIHRDGCARLILANAISLLSRSPKSRHADYLQCVVSDDVARGVKLEVPSYAVDRHTRRGRKMGRGVRHWIEEGCRLEPAPDAAFEVYRQEAESRWLAGVHKLDWSGKRSDTANLFEESKGESDDSSNEESTE